MTFTTRTAALCILLAASSCQPAGAGFQLIPAPEAPAASERPAQPSSPAPMRPPPPPSGDCTAPVLPGDSLSLLAARHLGDASRWRGIARLNHIREPDRIAAGWTLAMPCEGFRSSPPAETAASSAEPPGERIQRPAAEPDPEPGFSKPPRDPRDPPEPVPPLAASPAPSSAPADPPEPSAAPEPSAPSFRDPPALCSVAAKSGDSLSLLAARHLGDASRWRELVRLNGLSDPDRIVPGQLLRLPCASSAEGPPPEEETSPPRAMTDPVPDPSPPPSGSPALWTASEGDLLDDVIAAWALEAGWTPIIMKRWHWVFHTDYAFRGGFEDAVADVLTGFPSAGAEAPGIVYFDNRVMHLSHR